MSEWTGAGVQAPKVALYWDFENLHAVLTDQQNGQDYYREHRLTVQMPVAEVDAIVDYAASLGDVIINRAYANWQFFSRYRDALNGAGIDLIQLFPRGANMKNSADIRMALDALSDLHTHPHITHVVVVSCDSDFISLAQKVKQAGRFIGGVGVEGNSNRYWVASCNEFKFYGALLKLRQASEAVAASVLAREGQGEGGEPGEPADSGPTVLTVELAREALVKAVTQIIARQGENRVHCGALKSLMKRMMPAFDEGMLGCRSFKAFLQRFPDIVEFLDDEGGGHIALTPQALAHESTAEADRDDDA
ncbi:NYN domain-containing protein [uncultured Pseudacidovorax sp.]|uniref:NYN domain-containing protein n=1 Tax=uncultured Pseudacidovorax sp. TaxID=679313 RepID=UPI002600AA81|nr:NYN domain-containing protein [uncultured Pseudacidovorax sp.]